MPFCPKCGSEVTADAVFCPKCGSQIGAKPAVEVGYRGGEKREKEEKREKQEKPRDAIGPIIAGLILIWLGIVSYLAFMHHITDWWAYFLLGIGVMLIVHAIIRYYTYRGSAIGSLIGGMVLIVIGLASVYGVRDWWPFIIIALGIVVIVSAVTARRRTPKP